MISGRLIPGDGAFLQASVYFNAVGATIDVQFLADTGAQNSCLMPKAPSMLPLSIQTGLASQLQLGQPLQGIGGIALTYETPVILSFVHTDGETSKFHLNLSLIVDRRYADVPSMLGRDILFLGQLSAGLDGVGWDVEPGEHDLTG